jgi:phenylacetate-coenzyme A ligase PaaK-like adenylate-forming protein
VLSPKQLQNKVTEICKTFPWYASLVKDKKVESLSDLPLMTTEVLEKYYYKEPVKGAAGVYETSKTSSKKRKIISYSAHDEAVYLDIKTRHFANVIADANIRKVAIDVGIGHVCSTSRIIFDRLGLENITIDINVPLAEHIRLLHDFQPDLLYISPSLLDRILQVINDPRVFKIRKISPIGEVVTENWVKKTAAAFGIQDSDFHFSYGSTETGLMASYSHTHKKYLLIDGVYAEFLTAEEISSSLHPLAENERILVITSFNRQFFPGLRYVTYDVMRGSGLVSQNNRKRQAFDCIHRRVGTDFKHGERISIHDIENIVFHYVDRAVICPRVKDNRLYIGLKSNELTGPLLEKIEEGIQSAVPEIGIMIQNGLLESIKVEQLDEHAGLETGPEKRKRIRL